MSDFIEKCQVIDDYLCSCLIYGYSKSHVGTSIIIDRDVCSICIKFLSIPYSASLVFPTGLIMDKIHITLLYKATTPHDWTSEHQQNDDLPFHCTIRGRDSEFGDDRMTSHVSDRDSIESKNVDKWNDLIMRENTIYPFHCSMQYIRDKKLLNAVLVFVGWKCGYINGYWGGFYCDKYHPIYMEFDRYFNVIIDIFKLWFNMKYKYMVELIEMYEYYYWCTYVAKRVTTKELMDRLNMIWEKSVRFRFTEDTQTWNNNDQIIMSQLLQKIAVEYQQEVDVLMSDLDVMLDFVRTKYKMMATQIGDILEENVYDLEE